MGKYFKENLSPENIKEMINSDSAEVYKKYGLIAVLLLKVD